MADQKVSDLPSLNGADVDPADLLYIIDSSAGSAGSKKITVGQYQLAPVSGGTANGVMYLDGSKVVTTGSALVFDGSSLGLGVTPSAWQTGGTVKAIDLGTYAAVSQSSTRTSVWNNAYRGAAGAAFYKNNGLAALYDQDGGAHAWYNAPNNTSGAGAAATFTQAMTLDASGNLVLGNTSAYARLTSYVSSSGTFQNAFGASNGVDSDLQIRIKTGVSDFQNSAGVITFTTGTTERARITSGGDLLVGTTTASGVGNSIFGSSVPGVIHQNNNAASNGFVFTSYRRSSVEIGSVSQNGTTAVLFNTTSDRRLKQNITPAPSASDVIDAIEIVSHDWKAAPDEHVTYGVIAQDLALVAPQAVLQGDDGDEIEKTWGVDYSKLVPMLIKEIQTLRARVAALESA